MPKYLPILSPKKKSKMHKQINAGKNNYILLLSGSSTTLTVTASEWPPLQGD